MRDTRDMRAPRPAGRARLAQAAALPMVVERPERAVEAVATTREVQGVDRPKAADLQGPRPMGRPPATPRAGPWALPRRRPALERAVEASTPSTQEPPEQGRRPALVRPALVRPARVRPALGCAARQLRGLRHILRRTFARPRPAASRNWGRTRNPLSSGVFLSVPQVVRVVDIRSRSGGGAKSSPRHDRP